ncbi:MAG TPA: hypothetical protein VFH56_12510 [Acidimicrobiales bacterium]|nr:hypothetical protein [Acidimicrobiales bacterium]
MSKPEVWKTIDGLWVATIALDGWDDRSYFDTWEDALECALGLGLTYGVWSLP